MLITCHFLSKTQHFLQPSSLGILDGDPPLQRVKSLIYPAEPQFTTGSMFHATETRTIKTFGLFRAIFFCP